MEVPVIERRRGFEFVRLYKLILLIGALVIAIVYLPNSIWDSGNDVLRLALGGIAAWRYCWWLTHFVRAQVYARLVFPKLRRRAGELWSGGWRPRMLHFM